MAILDEKQRMAEQQYSRSTPPPGGNETATPEALVTDGCVIPDIEVPNDVPPAYGDQHDHLQFSQPGFEADAAVTGDGRANINIYTKNRRLADLLAPSFASQLVASQPSLPPVYTLPSLEGQPDKEPPPPLNIVIQIVGSRGDVQPFVALGKVLKEKYGHRVRVATHPTFQNFVEENDVEFFNIGGDPAELMAFMVKHPGLMPGFDAVKSGEISKRRKGVQQMLLGCWRSCIESGDGLGPPPRPHSKLQPWDSSVGMPGDENLEPFVADAIIANPPSFAHIHIAEKLGIPLHMMFTMPWSPTRAFPHPLANVQSSNADDVLTNYLTYTLVEMMTWQGLGDIINRFREKALGLAPLSLIWAPGLVSRLKISYTYCWSPALIPKPNDWGQHIDISGFFFLNLASSYTPDPELATFLQAGPPPVYIGFGSVVVDDPNAMTRKIFDAVRLAGVRALVSKGWGGLGADAVGLPEGVFMLGNVPHDWLFERVACVVHHGGAGTTAAGIKAGKPTIVVPFFGDQPFWGAMISRAKAGPDPITHKTLTAEKLAEGIKFCLRQETQDQAKALGQRIRQEDGSEAGSRSFHSHLDMGALRCSVAPSRAAAWRFKKSNIRLCPLAAAVLVDRGHLEYSDLSLYRPHEYNTEDQPPDPLTAGACSLTADISGIGMAIADMPREIFKPRQRRETTQPLPASSSKATGSSSDSVSKGASNAGIAGIASPLETNPGREVPKLRATSGSTNASQPSLPETSLLASPRVDTGRSVSPARGDLGASGSQLYQPSSRQKPYDAGPNIEAAMDVGKNVGRIVTTGVKSPMNFCLGLAKGFRNIPRLYNDDTVRPIEKVTDLNSGVKVASRELGLGFFDGISGLVMQPIRGAQKEGAGGLVKGIGKGIGGLIAKPAAGIWGLPGYLMLGAYAEVNKLLATSIQNYIITSRVVQGQRDLAKASGGEKDDIFNRWNSVVKESYMANKKERAAGKAPAGTPEQTGWLQTRHLSFDERKRRRLLQDNLKKKGISSVPVPEASGSSVLASLSADTEYEEAIQASVKETSRGDVEEDAMIEAAIRDSVNAVRERGALADPVPIPSDSKDPSLFEDAEWQITDEEYQDLVEQATRESMAGHVGNCARPQDSRSMKFDAADGSLAASDATRYGSGAAAGSRVSSEDAELQRAIDESRKMPALPPRKAADSDEEELQRAIAASKDEMERAKSQMTEEEIVMEYVKKQSLAEEFRQAKGKSSAGAENDEDDDEELKRAIEESLNLSKGGSSGPSGFAGQ